MEQHSWLVELAEKSLCLAWCMLEEALEEKDGKLTNSTFSILSSSIMMMKMLQLVLSPSSCLGAVSGWEMLASSSISQSVDRISPHCC